jgi:DNA repair exonuclease SbcCD nuclease subunit
MKILCIGDLHFKQDLAYADYVPDRRETERQEVLNTIVRAGTMADIIVFLGDNFDVKNPPSQVVRKFTEFVERFNGKPIYILAGNHEKSADGKSAIDYLKEVKNPNWEIITDIISTIGDMVFCPYFYRQELRTETYEEATKELMGRISTSSHPEPRSPQPNIGRFLFVHHAVSDTQTITGQNTNLFPEIVLPKTEIESMFDLIIGGHIHKPSQYGKTLVTGSIFTNEAGDTEKFVFLIDTESLNIETIKLPTRPIYRLENPKFELLESLNPNSIVKAVLTDKEAPSSEEYKQILRRFDAYVLIEQYPNQRKKLHLDEGAMLEFSVENLLGMYAEEKKVDLGKLLKAWELVK